MSKFDGAFAPMSDAEREEAAGKAAVSSVQTSLYLRLKKRHGARAGMIAWALVRCGQDWHADHEGAVVAVGERSFEELSVFIDAVRATREKSTADGKVLLDNIAARLHAARRVRAKESEG